MDADYLKQTVGPLVASALSSLVTYGYDATASYPRGHDPITFIAEYLIHHDKAAKNVAVHKKYRADLASLQSAFAAAEAQEKEARLRMEEEIKVKANKILERQSIADEESARRLAEDAARAAAAILAAAKQANEASEAERLANEPRGIPTVIEEAEEGKETEDAEEAVEEKPDIPTDTIAEEREDAE
ncbi:uncharacterized protein EV422DRAFT_25880 [Fimicolochytrium jonesii]|uniref:uncharacterized protein n=1 Tax=Fimicolochytrium jonesii TaxID=1396493 RepID=UPI0022FE54E7|nr:uncharacterized protein EV422DRAFT_25880 [Fimicolochytrium jonesii]KAI8827099.1 hypothetical protein EV422DRAFT_25880 [Fimicolochytrium jonesii]